MVDVAFEDNRQLTRLNGQDVTHLLREDRVGMAASNISKFPQVREYLLSLQREIAASQSCVLDGRDIGSVVLPDADLKIFLTADPKIRAQRRWKELIDKGVQVDLSEVEKDMLSRDAQDSGRKIAPTKQAVDAVLIDSGNLTIEESLDQVLALLKEKGLVL